MAVAGVALLTSNRVFAAEDCGTKTYFNWNCGGEGIAGLLITVLNWLAVGVAIAVVIGIIYGAILYTTSGGNPEQAKKGIVAIRSAIVAMAGYFMMWAALNWLVPGGVFN